MRPGEHAAPPRAAVDDVGHYEDVYEENRGTHASELKNSRVAHEKSRSGQDTGSAGYAWRT